MTKAAPIYLDLLGQELAIGNYVVCSRKSTYSSTLTVCQIIRFTPMKVCVKSIGKDQYQREWATWPSETVKMTGAESTAYILKNA